MPDALDSWTEDEFYRVISSTRRCGRGRIQKSSQFLPICFSDIYNIALIHHVYSSKKFLALSRFLQSSFANEIVLYVASQGWKM